MGDRRTSFAKFMSQKSSTSLTGGKLYGRQDEEQAVLSAYLRSRRVPSESPGDGNHQFLLISGAGGTGKTALANTIRQRVTVKDKGFFVWGKFEQLTHQEPYEAFVSALTQYTDQFLDSATDHRKEALQSAVLQAVGREAGLLTAVIPALERLLGKTEHTVTRVYGTEALHRFQFVFCKLVRALTANAPMVLFLDDLQWADTLSTELLRAVLHTPDTALLVICASRSKVDTADGPLSVLSTVRIHSKIKATQEDLPESTITGKAWMTPFEAIVHDIEREPASTIQVVKIELADLNQHDVNIFLSDLLHKTQEETRHLAKVLCVQTHGNIFHALHFLRFLFDQNVLWRNDNEVWKWDDDTLCLKVGSGKTIIDLVRKTLEGLPHQLQEALKVASCMGNEIDDSALDLVLLTSTAKILELAAEEGLLVFFPQFGGYRFAHDWIRQTAFEMIPEAELETLYAKIGRRLWKSSSPAALEKNIFVVVSLLNKGLSTIADERERCKVAALNLQAGEKAVSLAAFPNASNFLAKGIELLGPSGRWEDHYKLSLSLYSTASEVEVINGNFQRVVDLTQEVLQKAQSLNDKLRAYTSLIRCWALQQNIQEATAIGLDVLKKLGEHLPAKATAFTSGVELMRVKLALRGKSNQNLLALPPITNESKMASAQILSLIVLYCYQARSPFTSIVAFRSLLLTLKHGLHEGSSLAFAWYGMVLCGLSMDAKAGYRFGQLAISLADASNVKHVLPMVYFTTGGTINHWTQPAMESLSVLAHAAKIGMEVGNVESTLLALQVQSVYSAFFGLPLRRAEELTLEGVRLANLHRIHSTNNMNNVILQLIHCWTGRSKNPSRLSGSVIDFDETMAHFREIENKTWEAGVYFYSMVLAYTFGDYVFAGEMAKHMRDMRELKKTPSALWLTAETHFTEGLTAIALLRNTNPDHSNMWKARSSLKCLTKWAKESPRTFTAKQKILKAELLTLQARVDPKKCHAAYAEAIAEAVTEGYTKDAALACERAADFRHCMGDIQGAIFLWRRAIVLYDEWGATAKSNQLRAYDYLK